MLYHKTLRSLKAANPTTVHSVPTLCMLAERVQSRREDKKEGQKGDTAYQALGCVQSEPDLDKNESTRVSAIASSSNGRAEAVSGGKESSMAVWAAGVAVVTASGDRAGGADPGLALSGLGAAPRAPDSAEVTEWRAVTRSHHVRRLDDTSAIST